MEKIINTTPHAIYEVISGIEFPVSDIKVRVSSSAALAIEIAIEDKTLPLYRTNYGKVEGLPAQQSGIFYIVSGLVLSASDRTDLLAPGELVRDAAGNPIGCKGFRIN